MGAFNDDDELFGGGGDSGTEDYGDREAAIRMGRAQCDLCHGKGMLYEGQYVVRGVVNRYSKKRGGIVKKAVQRESLPGETCPKCFGLRYSAHTISDPREAEKYAKGPVTQDIDDQLNGMMPAWLRRSVGREPLRQEGQKRQGPRIEGTFDQRGHFDGQGNGSRRAVPVAKGLSMQREADGYISLKFK
jgi:hypothetical protein